jgi:hypothetical protein
MSRGFMFLAALALATPALPRASTAQVTPQGSTAALQVKTLGDALGIKPATSSGPTTLELGTTITFSLVDPAKLAKHTVRGMHEGARVTVTRIAPDRIRVEADEMEPLPVNGKATLRINPDGTFTPVTEAQRGRPPAL